MIKEYNYINIREVLSRVLRHPLLHDVTIEQAVQYTIDFIGTFGMPRLYQDKESIVCVNNYRAMLPCDLISINQIKNKDGICLRSMTDNFYSDSDAIEPAFKTQGQVLHTSFKTGEVVISYKAIPVDEFIKLRKELRDKKRIDNIVVEG